MKKARRVTGNDVTQAGGLIALRADGNGGGAIVGCPAYEQVRQPTMDNFDLKKYEGRWFEHAYHDWTQFSEVYDTTLDIKLSEDGKRWVDDFAVKGPSPKAARPSRGSRMTAAHGFTACHTRSIPRTRSCTSSSPRAGHNRRRFGRQFREPPGQPTRSGPR